VSGHSAEKVGSRWLGGGGDKEESISIQESDGGRTESDGNADCGTGLPSRTSYSLPERLSNVTTNSLSG
jgi:hypothetical protein